MVIKGGIIMRLNNKSEVADFVETINRCTGQVHLRSVEGDDYNLKSLFSFYAAIGRLINERYSGLDLYCDKRADENLFFSFFHLHPETL